MNTEYFELTILGTSGGPVEGANCSLLIGRISEQLDSPTDHVCIDAGTGIKGLNDILNYYNQFESAKDVKSKFLNTQNYFSGSFYPNCPSVAAYHSNTDSIVFPNSLQRYQKKSKGTNLQIADAFMNLQISTYLITHCHLDHVAGLIINAPMFYSEVHPHRLRKIYGGKFIVGQLHSFIFNNHVWPDLSEVAKPIIEFCSLDADNRSWVKLNEHMEFVLFPVAHGTIENHSAEPIVYHSSAFLLNMRKSQKKLLVFGDMESDLTSNTFYLQSLWTFICPYFHQLSGIVLECSTKNMPSDKPLYGHLTPHYVISEMIRFQEIIQKYNPELTLKGLNLVITHVKETMTEDDPRISILEQLELLNDKHKLGLVFSIALPGVSYKF
ncbi:3',5'-cyclic-nucleotide phosphodiesterase 1 [Komagataella phaffii CBS 7435]|uniref:Low-affinity cyclic AMP phosphodiesterase n=2 Tax=Komagataella phaffii TaxID=460519 RepID=C4QYU8_KOMPG|nr:Low-affinity cyclic AMP phosphodiesterase [Komagataella phaffii GS115]AOA60894.1 GQ67_01579T0 [Komagataella phaffii]CAH2447248.1 3',5'-cyclic-nucleotide phosphodiesterase 1 [Komagataella phaffii CBS 7435]AOA65839.1 GQ68_01595T0 [Komagataella phaffii GS115]CAY68422.1 Low-affinity cyclic AMP phosphodiesterase [Komagataella phaffii GS115]CCA37487.1 3',5'-cyclic-nucleotide phosphodiesterase 1 [Komagataella phaffii CBS 7435]